MFEKLARVRRSIRKYSDKPVPDELVREVLNTAILAPSAGNLQAWEFIIVKSNAKKRGIVNACYGQDFIADAPVVIIVCANMMRSGSKYGDRGKKFYAVADACIVSSYIQLAAADKGLGTVWVGAFDDDELSHLLSLPDHIRPISVLPLGYPGEDGHGKDRMSLDEVIHYEAY